MEIPTMRPGLVVLWRVAFGIALGLLTARVSLATAAGTPVAVDPAECTVQPLQIGQLTELVVSARPLAAPWQDPLPTAKNADDATLAAITALVRESVACTNANDPMRNFALFSDRYLIERFSADGGDDLGHLAAALTRHPKPATPADRLTLVSVTDAVMLDPNTVVATVSTANATTTFIDHLRFTKSGSDWKIDAVKLGTANGATLEATPASS
jgi:hypothetical protein